MALALLPNSRSVIAFDAAISSCEKCGRWQKALELLVVMIEEKLCPTEAHRKREDG